MGRDIKDSELSSPLHIEAQPIVESLSLRTLYSVPTIRAPEHPIGWPRAMAPPNALTLSKSRFNNLFMFILFSILKKDTRQCSDYLIMIWKLSQINSKIVPCIRQRHDSKCFINFMILNIFKCHTSMY
jgi:hypothetical protein